MSGTDLMTVAARKGWLVLGDTDTHMNRIQIRSESSSNLYTVAQTRKNGIWMCECLGYRGNRTFDGQGRRSCKHLKEAVPVFEAMLANPAAKSAPAKSSPAPAPRLPARGRRS